jgi:membrane-bound lytic murein transglycosylase
MDATSSNALYGMWIREGLNAGQPMTNIIMENVDIVNPATYGLYFYNMTAVTTFKNVKITGYSASCIGFRVDNTATGIQVIDQYQLTNCSATRVYATNNAYIFFKNNLVGVPALATASGYKGDWSYDASYQYFCYAVGAWGRIAKAW